MKPNRIVLALAFASLAGPAFAEKCHNCDFSDEPLVVTPKKAADTTPAGAPGGLATLPQSAEARGTYSKTLTFTLSTTNPADPAARLATPGAGSSKPKEIVVVGSKIEPKGSLGGGSGNDMLTSGFGNDTLGRGGAPAVRPVAAAPANSLPAESLSLNFTKIEYKYVPFDAKGPAAGAIAVRR